MLSNGDKYCEKLMESDDIINLQCTNTNVNQTLKKKKEEEEEEEEENKQTTVCTNDI